MKISQMRFQKIICITAFVVAALTLVFAWVFATDFFGLKEYYKEFEKIGDPVGRGFYEEIQPFNSKLELFGFLFLIIAALLFLLRTYARRRYYVVNYISTGVYSVFGFFYAVYTAIELIGFKNLYAEINFGGVVDYINAKNPAEDAEILVNNYVETVVPESPIFTVGIILCALVFIASALLIVNAVWKIVDGAKEDALYREEDAAIRAAQEEKAKKLAEEL